MNDAQRDVLRRKRGLEDAEWERLDNDQRPPGASRGKTPYGALREKLG